MAIKLRKGAVSHVRRLAKRKRNVELTDEQAERAAERRTIKDKRPGVGKNMTFDYAGDGKGSRDGKRGRIVARPTGGLKNPRKSVGEKRLERVKRKHALHMKNASNQKTQEILAKRAAAERARMRSQQSNQKTQEILAKKAAKGGLKGGRRSSATFKKKDRMTRKTYGGKVMS